MGAKSCKYDKITEIIVKKMILLDGVEWKKIGKNGN
jgi:hypothetical protein